MKMSRKQHSKLPNRSWLTGVGAILSLLAAISLADPSAAAPGQEAMNQSASVVRGPHGQYNPHATLGPESLIKVALQHQQEGRTPLAMQTLDEAIARYGDNADLYAVRGSLYLQQQKYANALEDLEKAATLAPKDARILVNRAQAYLQFGRKKEAMADLDRAIELQPDNLSARFNRGVLRVKAARNQEALQDFDRCIAVDPHTPAPYFNRAMVYDILGRRKDAEADLKRFIELSKNEKWKQSAQAILKRWSTGQVAKSADKPAESKTEVTKEKTP